MKKMCILVLCFVLLLSGCSVLPEETLPKSEPKSELAYPISWTPVYNEHQCGLQAGRSMPEGTVERELTHEEIATIVPDILRAEMETTGYAYFREDGSVYFLSLRMEYGDDYATVLFGPGVDWGACCLSLCMAEEGEKSVCGKAEYRLYQQSQPKGKIFVAHGRLHQVPVLVRIDSNDPNRDRPVFEKVLGDLAWYHDSGLDLGFLKP